jgi:hypothetical protein
MGRRRGSGRRMGRLLVGWRLGFGARERAAGIRFRGAWRPSAAPALQGGPAAMGPALASPLPRASRWGTAKEGEKSQGRG